MAEPNPENGPRFTYGDFIHWPEEERWELIDGIAYDMTPAPSRMHQQILGELLRQIGNALLEHPCKVYVAPFDVRLPDSDEANEQVRTVVQPDISVICDPAKLDDAGCRGAPDFIIEILSPSNASHDLVRKTGLYEKHGVREYWIIDPDARQVIIRLLGSNRRFDDATVRDIAAEAVPVDVLPGISLELAKAF